MTKSKIRYGIDAPPVIKQLGLTTLISLIIGLILYFVLRHINSDLAWTLFGIAIWIAAINAIFFCLMFWSSLYGKIRLRNHLLAKLTLKGNEQVLDVGCGHGLLLIGAAKQLRPGGHIIGLDLWRNEDLSNNREEVTKQNIQLAEVTDYASLISGDMTAMDFADNSFDLVLASNSIHNIPTRAQRARAIQEIARVLKPGGRAMLLDFQRTKEYKKTFQALGWQQVTLSRYYFLMFPPVRVVWATKP